MTNEQYKDLVLRCYKRAEIRRQIPNRHSVINGEPDRIADLLEEAGAAIDTLRNTKESLREMHTSMGYFFK